MRSKPGDGEGVGDGEAGAPSLVLYRASVQDPEMGSGVVADTSSPTFLPAPMPRKPEEVGGTTHPTEPEGTPSDGPPSEEALRSCPRKVGFLMFNPVTGQVAPARCKANSCPHCGAVNAMLVGGAIALAKPERFITLTQVGDDWQTRRNRLKALRHDIINAVGECDWAWHVEPNPAGTGHHVHAFQRGDFIPQAELSRLATRRGMGRVVDIRKFELPADQGANYGVKMAGVTYGLKATEQEATMKAYLDANGGRLVHSSRGFWQVDGEPVGQREAMKAWASRSASVSIGRWELIRAEHLGRAMAAAAG